MEYSVGKGGVSVGKGGVSVGKDKISGFISAPAVGLYHRCHRH